MGINAEKKERYNGPIYAYYCRDRWCINNGIYISPWATGEGAWYVDITINGTNHRSPETYGKVTIWIKLYEFYKYYYNKYANKV